MIPIHTFNTDSPDVKNDSFWLNIDKPIGITSARAVAIVKRLTGAKKVGHGGTLDPFASGILPIAINKATKTSEHLMMARKKYLFQIKWGEFRDTDDIEGKVVESSTIRPSTAEIVSALPFFVGKIQQTPSKFSAIKINGKRAYDLARQNIEFEMKSREVQIYSLKLVSNNAEFAEFEAECSKGTYIRTLSADICRKIKTKGNEIEGGVCGFVSKLTRLRVGKFTYDKTISLDLLKLVVTYGVRFVDGSLLSLQDILDINKTR